MKKIQFSRYRSNFYWHTMEGKRVHCLRPTKEFSIEISRIRKGIALPLYIKWFKSNEIFSKTHRLLVGFLFWDVAFTRIKFESDVEVIY